MKFSRKVSAGKKTKSEPARLLLPNCKQGPSTTAVFIQRFGKLVQTITIGYSLVTMLPPRSSAI
jgi:hypothetical protein